MCDDLKSTGDDTQRTHSSAAKRPTSGAENQSKTKADAENSSQLLACLVDANRSQLKRLASEFIRQSSPAVVSNLLQLAVEIGAWSVVPNPSRWQKMPHNLLSCALSFVSDHEMLLVVERVCRAWRHASLNGAGAVSLLLSLCCVLSFVCRLVKLESCCQTHIQKHSLSAAVALVWAAVQFSSCKRCRNEIDSLFSIFGPKIASSFTKILNSLFNNAWTLVYFVSDLIQHVHNAQFSLLLWCEFGLEFRFGFVIRSNAMDMERIFQMNSKPSYN